MSGGHSTSTGGAGQLVALGLDVVEQLAERLRELLDTLLFQSVDDVVVVDARVAQVVEELARAVDVALERVAGDLAVVLEGLDRLGRHGVHRVRADQLLDVHRVLVGVVLDRRRRPKAALRPRALARELLPAVAGEDLLVGLVGELGVGDRQLAAELFLALLVEALVGLAVHARDEERRDTRHLARVSAGLDEVLEALDVGLGDRAVAVQAEDQRDVDGDAGADRLLDRAQAVLRRGDLDVDVRAVDELAQARGLLDGGVAVERDLRIDLERHEPVDPAGALVGVAQDVARVLDVAHRELEEDLLGVLAALQDLLDLLVVGVAGRDRLLEDRGVGGHADDGVLLDQTLEIAVLEQRTRQEVDPDALALFGELMQT